MTRRRVAAAGAAVLTAILTAVAVAVWIDSGGGGRTGRAPRAAATGLAPPAGAAPGVAPGVVVPATTVAPSVAPTTTAPAPVATARPASVPATVPAAGPVCAGPADPAAPPFPGDDPRAGRRWVTVGRLAGRCDGASPVFHLRGIDTRLLFRSDGGSLVVFLVDARQGLDATAGYADAECEGPCSDSQVLVDQAGDYLLQVRAGTGPWEVAVQEYRAP